MNRLPKVMVTVIIHDLTFNLLERKYFHPVAYGYPNNITYVIPMPPTYNKSVFDINQIQFELSKK